MAMNPLKAAKKHWIKSNKIMQVTNEMRLMKRMAKQILAIANEQPESPEARTYALEIIEGVDNSLNDAMKIQFLQPNKKVMDHLDKCIEVVKLDRGKVQLYLNGMKGGA